MNLPELKKSFVLQHDQSDCGAACLLSIIQYHGGSITLDEIRRLTGTTKTGTKLLGLYQGGQSLGLEAKGLEAEKIDNLKELEEPAILHVILENRLQHYIVFYGFEKEQLIIGDPAKGISVWSKADLEEVWKSKSLLKLTPTERFVKKPKPENKYDKIKEWVKEDFNILLASLFLGIIIAIFSLATAIFSQKLIDVILPSEDITKLIIGLVLFGFILLARAGLGFVRSTFLITQSRDFNNRMITSFFHGLLGLPKPFFDSKKTGDMIARMNDTRRIQLTVSSLVGNLLIEFLVVLVSLAGVYIYSWQIGLVVTAILPIYIFILWKYNKPIITAQKDVMGKYSLNEANYVDVISGIPEIKSSGTGKLFHKVTTTFYQLFQQSIFNLGKIQVRFNLKTELIEIVLMLTVIAFASYLVITGQLMLGVLVAVLSLSGSIGPSLTRIALFNIQLQEAKVAFNRMEEFTSLDPEETKGEKIDTIHSIEIKNMYFTFPGSLELLKNINMEICKGQITTLLGESGVGKSTLLQIIQRFYQPNAGEILCNGKNAEGYDLDVYRTLFGAVSQDVKIFNNYLLFNIALTDDPEVLQKVPQWCQENGFDQFFAKFPQGYMTLLGEEGANISGGQKQLVALARALFKNPGVLLIDEGTSAMDRKTEQFILDMIQKRKDEMVVLMVSHRLKVAYQSDYVYVMENGSIIEQGIPAEIQSFNDELLIS